MQTHLASRSRESRVGGSSSTPCACARGRRERVCVSVCVCARAWGWNILTVRSPIHPALIDSAAPKNTLYLRQGGGDCGQTKRRCSFSQQTDLLSFSFSLTSSLLLFVSSSVYPSVLDVSQSVMSSHSAPENAFCDASGNSGFRDHCTSPLWQKTDLLESSHLLNMQFKLHTYGEMPSILIDAEICG